MSSEQNLPEVPSHQGPPPSQQQDALLESGTPHGMGQSKSSRRRRRKRKTTGGDFASETGSGANSGVVPTLQGQAGQQAPGGMSSVAPQQGSMQNGQQSGHSGQLPGQNGQQSGQNGQQPGQPGGAKRWKKKFRDRDRDRPRHADSGGSQQTGGFTPPASGPRDTNTHQFGNRSDSFKRKGGGSSGGGKQGRDRGPRSFVGPMDHSYRAVNGNFAETPPSTIETHGSAFHGRSKSYHSAGDSQPIDYSQGRTIPVAENAPTRIYFFIEDLFITAKINETARKLGVKVGFMKNEKEVIAEMLALEEQSRPGLIVFDLNNANAKPLTLIPKLKAKFKRSTSIVGFLSHLQGDLKAKATEAGCDTVMPRAAFSQNLPNLLRRYGLEEELDDANYNQ